MNVALTRAADGLPRRAFTVEDVRRMIEVGVIGEDERSELIEGDFVMMSAKGYAHEMIRKALVRTIVPAAPNDVEVGVEMTVQLAENVLLEPDLALFSQGSLRESRAGFVEVERGGCLLAIEVAVSSLAYDRGLKARLYARHGVKEFWVIDANARVTWVHTGATDERWSSIVERGPNDTLATSALPSFSIRLSDIE
jgi:Uma2 family endonuclease